MQSLYTMLVCMHAKSLQLYPTLCNLMDYSLPISVHGILQARILERAAMPCFKCPMLGI